MILLSGRGIANLLVLAGTVLLARTQQYQSDSGDQYQVTDDDIESPASSKSGVDYSQYFGAPTSQVNSAQPAAVETSSSGFVSPIDFSSLLATAQQGQAGSAVAASSGRLQDFFRAANSDQTPFALPLTAGVFPQELAGSATQNNGTGFTSPDVKFQSLFDASGSASEIGFRPQDFLVPAAANDEKNAEESSQPSQVSGLKIFSPSFAKLDKEYNTDPGPSYAQAIARASSESHQGQAVPRVPIAESYRTAPSEVNSGKATYPAPEGYNRQYRPSETNQGKYRASPSEANEGKAAYVAPEKYNNKQYNYRPSESNLEKSAYRASPTDANEGKTAYTAPAQFYPSKTNYRSSPSEVTQGKTNYRPAPSDVNQGYQSKVPVDVYGGKSSSYRAAAAEPYQGKSSYPGTESAAFNGKYGAKPAATSPAKINPEYFALSSNPGASAYSRTPASPYSKVPVAASSGDVYSAPRAEYRPLPSEEDAKVAAAPQQESTGGDKEKKCKKIEKTISADDVVKGRFKRQAMTCYICEDPKTGGNYEECSYASEPKSKKYFVGHAQTYSSDRNTKPTTYRYKRYLGDDPFGEEHDSYTSADSSSDFPYDFAASNHKDNYRFSPDYFGGSSSGSADYVSAAATNSDKNCKKVQKDSMTCYHCKDPKTGGSYEQCSYTSEPKANNYFVARESSYNSNDKNPAGYSERYRRNPIAHSRQIREEPDSVFDDMYGSSSKDAPKTDYNIPKALEFAESAQKLVLDKTSGKSGGLGLDPYLYGAPEPYDPKADKQATSASEKIDSFYAPYRSYEDYFHHLFPELEPGSKESASSGVETYDNGNNRQYSPSENSEQKAAPGFEYKTSLPEYFTDNEKKKDLDAVLGEFSQKDRSACKKVTKDKMTCYQCIDKKGMQHEECMFVAASEPKSQHLAYHEVKEFRLVPKPGEKSPAASSNVPAVVPKDSVPSSSDNSKTVQQQDKSTDDKVATTTVPIKNKRKAFFKKVTTPANPLTDSKVDESKETGKWQQVEDMEPEMAASTRSEKVSSKQVAPPPPELSEVDRSPDGLYSAETRTRFDPVLKVTLPEYMLSRSEHEAIFDEVMASGR